MEGWTGSRDRAGGVRTGERPIGIDAFDRLAHEFRTPLAAIRAIGEILRDEAELGPAERRALLEALLVEQGRLARTLEAVLDELAGR